MLKFIAGIFTCLIVVPFMLLGIVFGLAKDSFNWGIYIANIQTRTIFNLALEGLKKNG
jgi:hypothetical protein